MTMNVQELIEELMKIADKSKAVQVYSDGTCNDADVINEYDDSIVVF